MEIKYFTRKDLYVITFFLGAVSALTQAILIRELLTVFRGNEFIIGIIFSAWFLGIYLGARFNKKESVEILESRIKKSLLLLPIIFLLSIYAAHFFQIINSKTIGTFYSITIELVLSIIFTLPVSFFIGFFFPPAVTLISKEINEKSGGTIYFLESSGAFFGGILFSFIIINYLNPIGTMCILSFISLLIILNKNKKYIIIILIPLVLLVFCNKIEQSFFKLIWEKTHSGKLVQYKRTKYQLVTIELEEDRTSAYGDGILLYTLPDRYEARQSFHLIESLRRYHKKILLMGAGPGSLLENLLRTDIESLHYFEQDPQLWKIIKPIREKIYGPSNNKLDVVPEDMIYYLNNNSNKFDMIISLVSNPENIMLNRFFTREFFALCRQHLTEKGIFITSIEGFSNYIAMDQKMFIASIYKSFCKEFPYFLKTSGDTLYLIGFKNQNSLPENIISMLKSYSSKLKKININNFEKEIFENYSVDELKMIFEKSQLDYFNKVMFPIIQKTEENKILKPASYWYNIIFSSFRDRSLIHNIIKNQLVLPIVLLLASLLILLDIKNKYGTALFANGMTIFIVGFTSISVMLILIILYQNYEGIVYHRISLINALYMFGLTIGAYTFTRKKLLKLSYVFLFISIIVLSIFLYITYKHSVIFWIMIVLFSFFNGAIFPTLFNINIQEDYYLNASVLDSTDHFGSIIGSLFTTMLLLTSIGIPGTIYLISGILALTFLSLHFQKY